MKSRIEPKRIPFRRQVLLAGMVSLSAYALSLTLPPEPLPYRDWMAQAEAIMTESERSIRNHCAEARIPLDPAIDPNLTGLIGPEIAGLTTTVGHLEAKRTTTNPAFAALLVHLLYQSGVRPGDRVAIGSSGSFPALTIASLAAAEAMNVEAVAILSLGASGYGATRPEFHLLKIMELLVQAGDLRTQPAAVSLGGERDTGRDYSPLLREKLLQQISNSGIPLIDEPDLRLNVAARMALYRVDPGPSPISAFINAGGGFANLGTSNLVLKLRPGLNRSVALPPRRERGVLFEMAALDIPIIHMLYIEGLARQQNLPWDPSPLPGSGDWSPPIDASRRGPWFWWIAASHFAVLLLIVLQSLRFLKRREL